MSQIVPQPLPLTRKRPLAPPEELEWMRKEAPVCPIALPDGKVGWLLTRFEDVVGAMMNPAVSAQRKFQTTVTSVTLTPEEYAASRFGVTFIGMDPPEHTRYRRLLTGQFTVKRLKRLSPRIEQIVDERLDAIESAGPPADLVRDFAQPVPSLVICELLGMPYEKSKAFVERTAVIMRLERSKEELLTAMTEMSNDMAEVIEDKRRNPDDRLFSYLLSCKLDDGRPLTDEELIALGNLMMIAGYETTANMIGMGALALMTYRDQWEILRERPELAERAVEEMLRFMTVGPYCLPRTAKEDLEIAGQKIKAGDPILLSTESANRDPAQFDSPEVMDVTRTPKRHVGFAYGVHQCLGQELARMEMRIAFAKLVQRLPELRLTIPADDVRMRSDMQIYGPHELPVTW